MYTPNKGSSAKKKIASSGLKNNTMATAYIDEFNKSGSDDERENPNSTLSLKNI